MMVQLVTCLTNKNDSNEALSLLTFFSDGVGIVEMRILPPQSFWGDDVGRFT